jgi:hypothetical protein
MSGLNSCNPIVLLVSAMALALFAGWMAAGRRITAPATTDGAVTLRSSPLFCLLYAGFFGVPGLIFLPMGIDFLLYQSNEDIGGLFIRLCAGLIFLAAGCLLLLAARAYAIRLGVPDYVRVTEHGVESRSAGRIRKWSWSDIAGVHRSHAAGGPIFLILKKDEPARLRLRQRLGWFGRRMDPCKVSLGFFLKPTAMLESGPETALRVIESRLKRIG